VNLYYYEFEGEIGTLPAASMEDAFEYLYNQGIVPEAMEKGQELNGMPKVTLAKDDIKPDDLNGPKVTAFTRAIECLIMSELISAGGKPTKDDVYAGGVKVMGRLCIAFPFDADEITHAGYIAIDKVGDILG